MNQITKNPVGTLGYNFIPSKYLPKGQDEYYLRNRQNTNGIRYRGLTAYEIEVLVRNRNTSDNWNHILVSDAFLPEQVQNCKFFGLVRIGKLEPLYLEFNNLRRPVGLYNSTIISCDFGDNVVVDNVNYISHYIVGNEVILVNINELATTDYAKFGTGSLKEGEDESIRIWLELCNENGGRKVIPFNGMLPGDAYLWTRYRDNPSIQSRFRQFTEAISDKARGYYGVIGDRTVIKNCKILKDVNIGSDAYLKGANKIKNITINSSAQARTQIGEGCELVNGIIDYGCRLFYGVKAVRFFMASHSQLKYGARLINSYLGNNSTISCCEVLNSLIFPSHEQHHNNSFLCASLIQGQANMAAGATIGSNHNSRSADGEIIAGRGFWPGLCVSLKHNSRFASFTIISKGDYPAEMHIPIPFSLISNDETNDCLIVMPAYWFLYNMYALARNSWKYVDRDSRIEKAQHIEFSFLAPDTINEIITSLDIFHEYVGDAYLKNLPPTGAVSVEESIRTGKKLLQSKDPIVNELDIQAPGFEHGNRPVKIIKVQAAYDVFRDMIVYHAVNQLLSYLEEEGYNSLNDLIDELPARMPLSAWKNVGGQLIPAIELDRMIGKIEAGKIQTWDEVHEFYGEQATRYQRDKLLHALAALQTSHHINLKKADNQQLTSLLNHSFSIKKKIVDNIYQSRAKDYSNPFRSMVYDTPEEMDAVVGSLEDNSFISKERNDLAAYKKSVNRIIKNLRAEPVKKAVKK